jgi:protein-glutamine gamma-glutamyltransferase
MENPVQIPAQRPLQKLRQLPSSWQNLARDKTNTLLLLGACLLVLAPQATHLSIWVTLCTVAILGWRAMLTLYGKRLPPTWLLLPIAFISMGVVYLQHRTLLGREPGVAMLCLLLSCKLLEMHAKRDLFVVLFLSLFVILTNFLYSQSIMTALLMIAAVIAILSAQLSFQYTGRIPPLARRIRTAALIFIMSVPLALVLFVLFPRISGPLWGLPNDARSGSSGISPEMAPGKISQLALSEEIAFRVKFEGKPPPASSLYWRGPVLGRYDGRTWSPVQPGNGRRNSSNSENSSEQAVIKRLGPIINYQVTLEPTGQQWVYMLELPRTLPEIERRKIHINSELELLTNLPINERVRYNAASISKFQVQLTRVPGPVWFRLPPDINPRSRALARQIQEQFPAPMDQVNAILKLFNNAPFRYTLEPPLLGRDEIDDFLFTTRAGFCEHYASSFVFLMRAAGIPARVVTGYQGGELNPVDGFMSVRQSDAHAWAEVWISGQGWLRIDPTGAVAPERVEKNLASALRRANALDFLGLGDRLNALRTNQFSWLSKVRNNWNAINNNWNQWVLDYTPKRQLDLLKRLGIPNPNWKVLAFCAVGIGAAVMALVLFPLLWQRQRKEPLDLLYQRLCQQLKKIGSPRAPYEGPQGYALRLAQELHTEPQRSAVLRFLQVYSTAKYGPNTAPNEKQSALSTLKSLLLQCR